MKGFKKILSEKSFKKYFKTLSEIKLKTAPKGFDKNFSDIDLLKYTSYVVETPLENKILIDKSLIRQCISVQKAMLPFLKFLNDAAN